MKRYLSLPVFALLACLESVPTIAAGVPAVRVEAANPWPNELPTRLIPLRPERRSAQIGPLSQTQTPPPGTETAEPPRPAIPEEALKAEGERRWADAERAYREALEREPDRVDLLIRLSQVQAAAGKALEGARTLARAADLRPDDADLQLNASEAFGAADRPAEATRYNERALALRPNDENLLLRRARLAIWTGDNARAIETLRRLVAANPNDPTLKRDLGRVLGWQGLTEEAARVLADYVAQRPNDRDALLDLARLEAARGRSEPAADALRRYREAGGDEQVYRRELAETQLRSAFAAEADKRLGDAERIYRRMLDAEPNRADILIRLADVLAAEGKTLDAAETVGRAADLKSDDAQLQIRASEAFAAAGRPIDALRYVDRAFALRPNDLDLHQRRARLAAWAGKNAEAAESLRVLIAANPSDLSLKRDLGRILSWQGRFNEAVPLLSEYLAQYPDDKETLLELARIEAMRGNRRAALDLLERYRRAGGEDPIYRREREALRPGVHLPASRPSAVGPRKPAPPPRAAAAAPGPNLPAGALAAEQQKRYADAERIYRAALDREPGRVDLWRRLSDVFAVQGKRREAARALAMAADLRPQDVELQIRVSEGFAFADLPIDALRYVNRALAVRPNDLDLHRRRAQLAAWAGVNREAEQSLRALLAADPNDLRAKRDLGTVVGWQGRADEAVGLLSEYVSQRPDDKDAWLSLARNQMGRGNAHEAIEALRRYRETGGDETTYHRDLTMFLAWSGKPRAALALSAEGLANDPSDFQYRFARAVALHSGYEYGAAMTEAGYLAQLRPNAPELVGLRRAVEVAQRPYLQLDTNLYHESDDITIAGAEMSFHQPVRDGLWLMAGGGATYLNAKRGSLGAPIQGGTTMARGAAWLGGQARLDYATNATGRIGETYSGRGGPEVIWQAKLDSRLSDDLRVDLLNTRDLQIVSPRSVSLGITRIDTEAQLTYTPGLLWTVVASAREAELSDGNRFLRGYLSPRRAVLRTQNWNLDLGVSGNISHYREYPPQNGYYAPSLYQQYLVSSYVYYKISDEDGISLVASLGAHKDETMNSFRLTTAFATEATFGALSDWMAKIRAGYTNSGAAGGPNFSAESIGLTLVRRF